MPNDDDVASSRPARMAASDGAVRSEAADSTRRFGTMGTVPRIPIGRSPSARSGSAFSVHRTFSPARKAAIGFSDPGDAGSGCGPLRPRHEPEVEAAARRNGRTYRAVTERTRAIARIGRETSGPARGIVLAILASLPLWIAIVAEFL